jgi:hypothetical protein
MNKDNKYLIVWEKWTDPFGADDGLLEDKEETFEELYEEENQLEDNTNLEEYANILKNFRVPMIVTPFGLIPYTENTASSKIFNFWVGHTNFDINQSVFQILEKSEGVETLDVFTRYRFRIAIGKSFKDSQVMHNINSQVYKHLAKQE